MTTAISQYLTPAFGVALSPLPIIAIIVLCVIGRAKPAGFIFLLGWFLSILGFMIVAVALGIGADAGSKGAPSTWSIILQFGFAFLLLFLAWTNWRKRPHKGDEIQEPAWISGLSKMSNPSIFGLAALINLTNAKNLPIMASVAIILAQSHDGWAGGIFDGMIFALIGSLGVLIPWLMSVFGGEAVKPRLEKMRDWLYKYNNIIMTFLFGFLGLNALSGALALVT